MEKRKKNNYIYYLPIGLFLLLVQLYFVRTGADITDQAFWVAEPYLITQGATPVYDNWNQTPLTSILIAPIIKLFITLTSGTQGIIKFFHKTLY